MSDIQYILRKLNEKNKNTDLVLFAFQLSGMLKDFKKENCNFTEKDLLSIEKALSQSGLLMSELLSW